MFKRKKRGQAAMEFLLTYGWAILVVLVVIGALSYFGVLNPGALLPDKCQFAAGFNCVDYAIDSNNGIQIQLNNGQGRNIYINSINITDPQSVTGSCGKIYSSGDQIIAGQTKLFTIGDSSSPGDCTTGFFKVGTKQRLQITMNYNFQGSTITRVAGGEMYSTVQ